MMYGWLDDAVTPGTVVITSSRRLARELRASYDERRIADGARAWPTPDIVYWQDWLVRLFDAAAVGSAPLLLSVPASSLLWEQCLTHTSPPDVLSIGAIVRPARQAWQRLNEWQVSLAELARTAFSNDERWFARAAGSFEARLRSGNWIDAAELPARVAEMVREERVPVPERLIGVGFDRVVPALQQLAAHLDARKCNVLFRSPPTKTVATRKAAYIHEAGEWRAAGAALRRALQDEPTLRVGIIAPDLDRRAEATARLLREGFAPGWQLAADRYRSTVDVSYGRRLSDYPLIGVALLCLEWTHTGLAGDQVSVLLRSPLIGADDLPERSRFERFLRTLPDRTWRAHDVLALCRASQRLHDGAWHERLSAIANVVVEARGNAAPADWARRFDALLAIVGWPGLPRPDSVEFQLINRWRQLLNELARIDAVRPSLRLAEAVQRLRRIAGDTVYQPEARPGAVHLLGMAEAAGMEFDHLWIGGLDASRWPPAGHPLALVSRALQRARGMPDASPGDTLGFARQVFRSRLGAAKRVTLSWPQSDDDAALTPSPFLDDVAQGTGPVSSDPGWYATTLRASREMERLDADTGPAVASDETIVGGAGTIQRQHEEPFSAFARGRLGVSGFHLLQRGLSERHRGIALHDALQILLQARPSRAEIAAWSVEDRDARIGAAVDGSLRAFYRHADDVLKRLLIIERRRMQALLQNFIAEEVRRDDFTVRAVEETRRFESGPVSLDLRVDRIDRLADGALLIIDYKSGRDRSLQTQGGDLAEMQLAVYARALAEPIGGLLLINLDSRAIVYRGVGASVPWGKADRDEWRALLASWMTRIDELVRALAQGDLRVNLRLPGAQTRALGLLSRIEEIRRGG